MTRLEAPSPDNLWTGLHYRGMRKTLSRVQNKFLHEGSGAIALRSFQL